MTLHDTPHDALHTQPQGTAESEKPLAAEHGLAVVSHRVVGKTTML